MIAVSVTIWSAAIARDLIWEMRDEPLENRTSVRLLLAVVVTGGQSLTAFGASSPASSPSPSRAQSIAAEQSGAASAGQALGLGSGEKLVVKDVVTDADGTIHVRYNRTFGESRLAPVP